MTRACPKKPTSAKQLEANRRNALKSTGPKSDSGKARASQNAFRHGLTGQVSVKTEEDRIAHAAFTQRLSASLKPEGDIEEQLALSIAEAYWRLNRARAIEDNVFALGHYTPAGDLDTGNAEIHAALTSARVFLESSKELERLTLYEQRIHRALQKDMAQLEHLQAKRKAEREAALAEAAQQLVLAEQHGDVNVQTLVVTVNGFEFSNAEIRARLQRNRLSLQSRRLAKAA